MEYDFDNWFDIFSERCRNLGYEGRIDKETFRSAWEEELAPEDVAYGFVHDMLFGE